MSRTGIISHGSGKIGIGQDLGDGGVEPGHGHGPDGHRAEDVCSVLLKEDGGGVGIAGLHHRVLRDHAAVPRVLDDPGKGE